MNIAVGIVLIVFVAVSVLIMYAKWRGLYDGNH